MRGMKIVTVAGVPACMIGAAKAEELGGTIDAIDTPSAPGDKIFALSLQHGWSPNRGSEKKGPREDLLRVGQVRSETECDAITIDKQGG